MLLIRFMEKHVYWSTIIAICALTVHDVVSAIPVARELFEPDIFLTD